MRPASARAACRSPFPEFTHPLLGNKVAQLNFTQVALQSTSFPGIVWPRVQNILEILVKHITRGSFGLMLIATIVGFSAAVAQSPATGAGPSTASAMRDGQHDFDFTIGKWKTHITRLQNPLSGSAAWIKMEGTKLERKIWNGRAHLEEIEADGPTGHFEGLTLFLYDPQARQWSQTFASSKDGTLGKPLIGEFKNGRGEFFGQDTFKGRTILVRATWSDITHDSHKFEQAFSDDGGRTWETNFIAMLTREKATGESE